MNSNSTPGTLNGWPPGPIELTVPWSVPAAGCSAPRLEVVACNTARILANIHIRTRGESLRPLRLCGSDLRIAILRRQRIIAVRRPLRPRPESVEGPIGLQRLSCCVLLNHIDFILVSRERFSSPLEFCSVHLLLSLGRQWRYPIALPPRAPLRIADPLSDPALLPR